MKKCYTCKQEKDDSEFSKTKTGLHSSCKSCNSAYQKEWTKKNYASRNAQIHKRRNDIKRWFSELKKEKQLKCMICGEDRLPALDFHHRNPEEKDRNVVDMANKGWSKSKILMEVEKCDILCSNCHRILHYKERNA